MKKIIFLVLALFLITFTSAQLGYNNPRLPRIESPTITITSSGGGSGNVTSVASGDGCIFVSPTTGDVVITFNTSCGSTTALRNIFDQDLNTTNSARFISLNISGEVFVNNASAVSIWLYNQTSAVFTQILLNDTIAQEGVRIGFNNSIMRNIFNQDLNTTNDVQFRNISAKNITYTDRLFGRRIRLDDSQAGAVFPTTTLEVMTTAVGLFGITLLKMTGGSGLINVGALANGLYLLEVDSKPQLVLGNSSFTGNWVFNYESDRNLKISFQDTLNSLFLLDKSIILNNNLTARNISAESYQGDGSRLTFTRANASADFCITGGNCLNKTITLNSLPYYNNTMIYWNNDTRNWIIIPESPANAESPVYCSGGSTPRWTFIDNTAGVCPL